MSSLRVIPPHTLTKMTSSLAGIHVSHELVSVLLRSYAFKRGKFYLTISYKDGDPDDNLSSRTKFLSPALSIRRLNEPNGGLNIGLC